MPSDIQLTDEGVDLIGKEINVRRTENGDSLIILGPNGVSVGPDGYLRIGTRDDGTPLIEFSRDQQTVRLQMGDPRSRSKASTNGRIELEGDDTRIELRGSMGPYKNVPRVNINTQNEEPGQITGNAGRLNRVSIDGQTGKIVLGGSLADGDVIIRDKGGDVTIGLNGQTGNATLGGGDVDGGLILLNEDGERVVQIHGGAGKSVDGPVRFYVNGQKGTSTLGGADTVGTLKILNRNDEDIARIDGGVLGLGTRIDAGDPHVAHRFVLDGQSGEIRLNDSMGTARLLLNTEPLRLVLADNQGTELLVVKDDGVVQCTDVSTDEIGSLSTKISDLTSTIEELQSRVDTLENEP